MTWLKDPEAFRIARWYAEAGDEKPIDVLSKAFQDAQTNKVKVPEYAKALQKQFKTETPCTVNGDNDAVQALADDLMTKSRIGQLRVQ